MKFRMLVVVGLLMLTLRIVHGQDQADFTTFLVERFQLFNHCNAMSLIISDLSEDAKDLGLTQDSLRYAIESRLRAARLYSSSKQEGQAMLIVGVSVLERSFNVEIHLAKDVTDVATGIKNIATTWTSGTIGTANQSSFILSSVQRNMDKFLTEYLRVNELACESR